jgi:hypothetical protein
VTVFNDEFSGDRVELHWDVREGSPSNQVLAQGQVHLSIPPGSQSQAAIIFGAPQATGVLFLTLRVVKEGVERFKDSLTCFAVTQPEG